MIIRMLVVVVLMLIFWLGTRNLKLVPGRGQVASSSSSTSCATTSSIETLGEKDGKRFMPLLITIFFLTLGLNLTGTIPGLQIASTGLIGQAIIMAVVAYVTFIYAGIRKHGLRFFKNALDAAGRPDADRPDHLAPLEFLSTFILRPITLTLRLTMNMVAGHMLLVAVLPRDATSSSSPCSPAATSLGLLGVGTLAFGIAFTVLEIFIAAPAGLRLHHPHRHLHPAGAGRRALSSVGALLPPPRKETPQ